MEQDDVALKIEKTDSRSLVKNYKMNEEVSLNAKAPDIKTDNYIDTVEFATSTEI